MKPILTEVFNLHHQPETGQTTTVNEAVSSESITDEQPVVRRQKAEETWQPLYTGWLDACSCVVLTHKPLIIRQTIPTPEEAKTEAAKRLEVRIGTAEFTIAPGRSMVFNPKDLTAVEVRSEQGCYCMTTIFPR